MRAILARYAGYGLVAMFLASCATTSLVDTWRNPDMPAVKGYHKLLVSSTGRDINERQVYEDVMVAELRQHGVEAVASYPLMRTGERDRGKALDSAVKQSGSDAVLSVRTTMVEQKTSVVPGYVSGYPGYPDFWYPPAFHEWNMNGYYGTRMLYEPPTIIAYTVATMQVNLFDVASGKLTWAASLETTEPGKVLAVSRDVARIVVEKLKKLGLI
jgi:hypothetical protein